MLRILRWIVISKLLPAHTQLILPFVNDARLVARPGRWGGEANALCGLHEFSDMAFLLHFLRPTDIFCDIGANIGAYTVLASAAIGARSVAFEPIASSYRELQTNLAVNQLTERVDAYRIAVGSKSGSLMLTSKFDTTNHVVFEAEDEAHERVSVNTLDRCLAGRVPALIKVDVEGWEHEVLQGSVDTLCQPGLLAIIVELNQAGKRYGFSDEDVHQQLLSNNFSSYRYDPFKRALIGLGRPHNSSGNTLYIRNRPLVAQRLQSAAPFTIGNLII